MDRILQQSDNQQLQVLKLSEKLEERNKKVNTLLDNAGQGFLYFDKNMIIGDEYSSEVFKIFNEDVANKNITKLLYKSLSKQEFLTSTLQGILNESELRQEILISLLQNEFIINNKIINIEYKVLDNKNFMLILTDITIQKELDQKIKNEQQILKMVVEVVTTLEQFVEIKTNYINLILMINNYKDINDLPFLKMQIHTFKGLFAQKEMLHIVKHLHSFEDEINKSIDDNKLTPILQNIKFDDMNSWLEEDIKILKDILGDDFFDKENHISLDKNRIGKLYEKIKLYFSNINANDETSKDILNNIEELKYHSVKILFRPYEKLVEQLSKRLNKKVNPLYIQGQDIYIGNIYKSFIHALVHIFRNSLDHGIEPAEIRMEKGKPEKGTISCIVTKDSHNITIKIKDDGAGIKLSKLKNKALEKNIISKEQLDLLSDDDVLRLIFHSDFSTSEQITDISGRGIGMSSVLDELNKLHGTVIINNIEDIGLEFIFSLPIINNIDSKQDILKKLSIRTIGYFGEFLNLQFNEQYLIEEVESIKNNVAIIISLTNDMDGTIYFGVSETFARKLIYDFIDESMSKQEILDLSTNNIAEILNITLGNILQDLYIMKNGGVVGISTPEILNYNEEITKKTNSQILISTLTYQDEEIILGYFI